MKTLSLVIPTYNEELNLTSLFLAINELNVDLKVNRIDLQVVFVDNSSTDGTWEKLTFLSEESKGVSYVLVRHPVNLGMQQSLLTGVRHSTGDAIAILQSDLQDPPEILSQMVDSWVSGAVFVARKIENRKGSLIPRLGAWGFYRLLSFVSDDRVIADSSDFYLFDSSLKAQLINASGTTPFLRVSLSAIREPDVVISYKRVDRTSGKTNYSLKRRVNFALDALLKNLGGLVKKVISFSIVLGFVTLIALVGLTLSYLLGYRSPVGGWISTIGILLVLLSTTLFIGAVTLELLSRIYRDLPRYDPSSQSEVLKFKKRS